MTATGDSITFRAGGRTPAAGDEIPNEDYAVKPPPETVVSPEKAAVAEGSSLAARLRAKRAELQIERTGRFPVPPDSLWHGELVLVAKGIEVRQALNDLPFLERVTHHLEYWNQDTGEWEQIAGWEQIGEMMGLSGEISVGRIILTVCDGKMIIVGAFAKEIAEWVLGRGPEVERQLGE